MNSLITTIPIISAVAAGIWGLYIFNRQQRFKRLQNLSQIFQRFADKNDFMELFTLCDQVFIDKSNQSNLDELSKFSAVNKMRYLALLEEVALFSRYSEVDKEYAVYLFQWHFYYIYNDSTVSESFWKNIGEVVEKDKPYWKYQKDFSVSCNPN